MKGASLPVVLREAKLWKIPHPFRLTFIAKHRNYSGFQVHGSWFTADWLALFIFLEIASNRNPRLTLNREP
ncbi:MAG: hypothetical protein CO012_03415 [Syntrophobacterales bacterium CG_4_8_14_3_um_filter_49_14]|nr:MAG: hypothetical protein COX52_11820 [Syntrophobacterales bacterium CG23_combo_of_CG06-09_8_20_14_all_48_27]PJC75391.1 MAG: hypothetical protein CO012_03415 [Syntrophobacterales bacterium CG_4_8_14_3_um_filter_49_14]